MEQKTQDLLSEVVNDSDVCPGCNLVYERPEKRDQPRDTWAWRRCPTADCKYHGATVTYSSDWQARARVAIAELRATTNPPRLLEEVRRRRESLAVLLSAEYQYLRDSGWKQVATGDGSTWEYPDNRVWDGKRLSTLAAVQTQKTWDLVDEKMGDGLHTRLRNQ